MDRERLHGSFSWTDVTTLIRFNVCLGKSAVECYKLLKEGLGTCAPSYETVRLWAKAIKNGREETRDAPHGKAPTSARDKRHVEQVKSVLEHTHSISCTATVTEIGITPASVYHILTNSSEKQKFVQVDSTHAQR
jgi:transposase